MGVLAAQAAGSRQGKVMGMQLQCSSSSNDGGKLRRLNLVFIVFTSCLRAVLIDQMAYK